MVNAALTIMVNNPFTNTRPPRLDAAAHLLRPHGGAGARRPATAALPIFARFRPPQLTSPHGRRIPPRGTRLPNEARLSERVDDMTNPALPAARPANPNFSSGPCAKRPGWSLDGLKGAALGRSHRAKIGKQKLKQAIDLTREVLEVPDDLPDRHRAGLRHRRARDGAVVAARRPQGRRARLGELRPRLGDRRDEAAQAPRRPHHQGRLRPAPRPQAGRFQPRRGLHLERHDLRRARAERRLDPGGPRGPDHLRRDLGRLRPEPRFRRSSMSSPSPGRRRSAARRRTA